MPFLNIFSKKPIKRKEPSKQKVIVDHREKNSLVVAELIALGNEIEFKQLQVADYLVEDIAIERKTGVDLVSSMITKRIFYQIKDLKQYDRPLLIVESYQDLDLSESKISENAIKGLILSISLEHKIPVIFTKDPKDTSLFISLIAKKKKTEASLRAKLKMTDSKRLQFILEGFPSIGPVTAKKLLTKYKTIKNIINTQEGEIHQILGKKADKFLELIKKEYLEKE